MANKKDIPLPYTEAFSITDVANFLDCSVNNIIEWSKRGLFDLCIKSDSLYGELYISCKKNAPVVKNYIDRQNEILMKYEPNKELKTFESFKPQDLLSFIMQSNDYRFLGSRYHKKSFIIDESDAVNFSLRLITKGLGFWVIPNFYLIRAGIQTIHNQFFYNIQKLDFNYKFYEIRPSFPKNYIKGLNASLSLFDPILISDSDFYIHNVDYHLLINGQFSTQNNTITENEKNIIGKPSNFYKSFAINSAVLTRTKFPFCKVANIAKKLHIKIINEFNAANPPAEETIANWLYEIKLGKPEIRSNDDFELIIPDEWIDFSE